MVMFGHGILITGNSGTGKTRLCQQLLGRGHQIIADDATTLFYQDGHLHASSPPFSLGKIVLDNTICSIAEVFGAKSWVEQHKLSLHVELDQTHRNHSQQSYTNILPTTQAGKEISLDVSAFELLVQNTLDCSHLSNPPGIYVKDKNNPDQ